MVDALIRNLLRFRAWWLAALALLVIVSAGAASRLEFDFSFRSFFAEGRDDDAFTRELDQRLGNTGGSSLVAVLQSSDIFQPAVLAAITVMSERIEKLPHIDRVQSLATVPFILGNTVDISIEPAATLVKDGADPAAIRRAMLESPLYRRRLVSSDGTTTAVLALLDASHQGVAARAPTIEAFRNAITSNLPLGVTARFTGYPFAEAEYARLVWKGFFSAEGAGILVMGLILWSCFGSMIGVVLPLVTVGLATIVTLGVMQMLGQRITFTNASVPLLVLVIGIGEVAFFIARYLEEAALGGTVEDVIVRMAHGVVGPGFVAASTTSAGFASLVTGRIALTRDLGIALTFGILATFFIALVLVTVTLSYLPLPAISLRPRRVERSVRAWLGWVAYVIRSYPVGIGTTAILVMGLGTYGATRVSVAQFAMKELPADNPIRVVERQVDAELSGTYETKVGMRRVDGGSMATPEALANVAAIVRFLEGQPNVAKAWSVVDYLQELNVAANDGDARFRTIPGTAAGIGQFLLLLSSGKGAAEVDRLLDHQGHTAAISIGTTDLGTNELIGLAARLREYVASLPEPQLDIRLVGDYWQVSLGADSLVRDLFVSTLTSFLIVFAMVALFLRSWRLTLLSIPPNLLPLAAALGLMGFGGITLRVGTSIILPVALGIAVDSTVHCMARMREEWLQSGDYDDAMGRTLLGTGQGMIFSALALVLGFLCFLIPEFLVFRHIGVLGAGTLLVAALADLFLTPSLLIWFRPFRR